MEATRPSLGYRTVRALARTVLRSEFRAIEVDGADRIPATGPVVIVANHFSSIVDPLALIHASPRPPCLLARAPLWNSRVLAFFLDLLECIPVYRGQDVAENRGRTTAANAAMLRSCRERLDHGRAVAVFPEGLSQPGPRLMPIRTGAARIALDASGPVTVCPAALVYGPPAGGRRGTLLVTFGQPFVVSSTDGGASPRERVRTLTRRIDAALHDLLVEPRTQTDLDLLRVLRVVRDQEEGRSPASTLAEAHRREQALGRGVTALARVAPDVFEELRSATDDYRRAVRIAGLGPEDLGRRYDVGRVLRFVVLRLPLWALGTPVAWAAALLTWPVRRLGDLIALRRFGGRQDMRGLCRMLGGLSLLLLAMVVGGVAGWIAGGPWVALAVVVGLPLLLVFVVRWRDLSRTNAARVKAFFLLAGANLRRNLVGQRGRLYALFGAARKRVEEASPPAP